MIFIKQQCRLSNIRTAHKNTQGCRLVIIRSVFITFLEIKLNEYINLHFQCNKLNFVTLNFALNTNKDL